MSAMTRCPSCAHYWDATDQRVAPELDERLREVQRAASVGIAAADGALGASWLQQLLATLLPVVEPLVEKWVRDLLTRK